MRNPSLRFAVLSSLLLMVLTATACHAVIYVWKDAPGPTQDGNSWATAYRSLSLARSDSGATTEETWVAAGTYSEMVNLQPMTKLYGGFSGTETYKEQRDWNANPTIINPGVTYAISVSGTANPSQVTVIDGFTITGASMYGVMVTSVPCNILNCRIAGNGTSWAANGVSANGTGAYIRVAGCIIAGNTGAGVTVNGCSAVYVTNCTIVGNNGAGIETENSSTWTANNILAFNGTGLLLKAGSAQGSSNCVYGNTTNYS